MNGANKRLRKPQINEILSHDVVLDASSPFWIRELIKY